MAHETWETVAIPILSYIADHEEDGLIGIGDIADAIGAKPMTVALEIDRLASAGYLRSGVNRQLTGGDARPWFFQPLLEERGARVIGIWPGEDPYADFLNAIDRRIAEEVQPEERSKLQKFRAGVADVGKGVAVGVLLDVAKRGGL